MKNPACILISSLFLLNTCVISIAQTDSSSGIGNDLYKSVINEYGFDQVLINGISYQDNYHGKLGHPFLFGDQFYKGTLVFRSIEYQGVDLKYDIYKQQVIIYIVQNDFTTWIIPPKDFISGFYIGDKRFKKYTFRGVPEFFQVIFDTKDLKCLYYWSKSRFDSGSIMDLTVSLRDIPAPYTAGFTPRKIIITCGKAQMHTLIPFILKPLDRLQRCFLSRLRISHEPN